MGVLRLVFLLLLLLLFYWIFLVLVFFFQIDKICQERKKRKKGNKQGNKQGFSSYGCCQKNYWIPSMKWTKVILEVIFPDFTLSGFFICTSLIFLHLHATRTCKLHVHYHLHSWTQLLWVFKVSHFDLHTWDRKVSTCHDWFELHQK